MRRMALSAIALVFTASCAPRTARPTLTGDTSGAPSDIEESGRNPDGSCDANYSLSTDEIEALDVVKAPVLFPCTLPSQFAKSEGTLPEKPTADIYSIHWKAGDETFAITGGSTECLEEGADIKKTTDREVDGITYTRSDLDGFSVVCWQFGADEAPSTYVLMYSSPKPADIDLISYAAAAEQPGD